MNEVSRNWDLSRLAYMDIVIMQIAIAELMTFPNIPVSVTINEFVDIAKLYSTSKSGGYINGMLDAIARNLIKSNRLMKHMEPQKGSKEDAPKEGPAEINAVPVKMRHRKRIIRSDEGEKKDKKD
jgi:N utilization substance protein B